MRWYHMIGGLTLVLLLTMLGLPGLSMRRALAGLTDSRDKRATAPKISPRRSLQNLRPRYGPVAWGR